MRTYNIDIARIRARRRRSYDLDDVYLWIYNYVRDNPQQWKRHNTTRHGDKATISDDATHSFLQIDAPRIELINEKQNFVTICEGKSWLPRTIILRINGSPSSAKLTDNSQHILLQFISKSSHLLFLKKAGPGIGGGHDVTPIILHPDDHVEDIERKVINSIAKQNVEARYRRRVFILQEGIIHPLLTPKSQKMDLRLYMLIVGRMHKISFYACRIGDERNTLAGPYDPYSDDITLQVTNITQSKTLKEFRTLSQVTRIFSPENSPEWYDIIFNQFLTIGRDVGELYAPLLHYPNEYDDRNNFFSLIGFDIIVDRTTMKAFVVELNRRPTIYTPEEAKNINYSSVLFMPDLIKLSIEDNNTRTGCQMFVPVYSLLQ